MNLDAATATIRALAAVAGVPNADSVTIAIKPYKGVGERTFNKGRVTAIAVGWPSGYQREQLASNCSADDGAAVDELLRYAKQRAQAAVDAAKREAERLSDVARAATTAAANAEADAETRRLMLASLDAPAAPARPTHYAVVVLAPEMVDGVVKARVTGVYAYADGRYDEHARSVATHSLSRIVNVPADTIVESVIDVRPWG